MTPSALATADQNTLEICALQILASREMKEQIELNRLRLLADPRAAIADAKRAVPQDIEELATAVALIAANTDAARPKVAWVYNAPRNWFGRQVPGSRWGIDNPDNVYRIVAVDDVSSYEVQVRQHGPAPVQYSFLLYDHFVAEDGHLAHVDKPIGGFRDCDLQKEEDGSFTITIDPHPAAGRPNHIQSKVGARQLLIRNTLADWEKQNPLAIAVNRVDGPPAGAPHSLGEMTRRALILMDAITDLVLKWKSHQLFGQWAPNVVCAPYGRGRSWGFAATGDFRLAPDEALVITAHPLAAQYFGVHLTDLWLASLDHVNACTSLNANQAVADPDSTYTFVVCATDPQVHNWLDTRGLREGGLIIRWQQLPESQSSAEGAVRNVTVVKLSELNRVLPAGTKSVTATDRKAALTHRAKAYAHRYLS